MKRAVRSLLFLTLISGFLVACNGGPFKEAKTFTGGKIVNADTLNLGYTTYTEYCVSCHGVNGDGQGISAKGMWPPPRNFKLGLYKFGWVATGELPHDEDFYRIIKKGLHGTPMLPWDISEKRLDAVVQYIKTFAPEAWEAKGKNLGEKIEATKDPYMLPRKDYAIQYGKEVYHAVASCQTCHQAYATKAEITEYSKKFNPTSVAPEFDANLYAIKLQDSEHGYKALPPDFTFHPIRSASNVEEIYMRLNAGVGGTSMPAWKGVLEDDQIWAVAYYVKSLMEIKDNLAAREELVTKLKNQ
jgi:mono/diheme cytochrome c family protein